MATKKTKDEPKPKAEESGEIDEAKLSYAEIAALSDQPVVTTTRVIQQFPPKEEVDKGVKPDIVLTTTVIWGPLPPEPPPKPNRRAATLSTHIIERGAAPAKRPPSIGSMAVPGGKK